MGEKLKTYEEGFKDFIRIISDPDFAKDAKIQVEDEYHVARLATAHFGKNILGSRRVCLTDKTRLRKSAEEAKGGFLSGLQTVDVSKLPEERAKEFQAILELAKTGNWDNLVFINQLNTFCYRFSCQLPVFSEGDRVISV